MARVLAAPPAAMSPLVALLALACAAPLAVQAQTICAKGYGGYVTPHELLLQPVNLLAGYSDDKIDIPDDCARVGKVLVGVTVEVCDYCKDDIQVPQMSPFSPVLVHRNCPANYVIQAKITEYCENRLY